MVSYRNLGKIEQNKQDQVIRIDLPDNDSYFTHEKIIVGKAPDGWWLMIQFVTISAES